MRRPGDRYLNRLADNTREPISVLMFGTRWLIEPGKSYGVRVRGAKRTIVELRDHPAPQASALKST